jgi:hypothetical protein
MHPTIPSLFFIGLFQPLACIWRLAHYQSRIAALQLSGRLSRPPDIDTHIHHEVADHVCRSPRHAIEVDYHTFRRKLLNELRREQPSARERDGRVLPPRGPSTTPRRIVSSLSRMAC